MAKKVLGIVSVLALLGGFCFGDVHRVRPGRSIQEAIEGAVFGDAVYVEAGVYTENIVMKDGVSVIGAGPVVTTIDGDASDTVVIATGCGSETLLEGFHIVNGRSSYYGGGLYLASGTLLIRDCWFSGNLATYCGGGIACDGGNPTIENCAVFGNQVSRKNGGGIYFRGSSRYTTLKSTVVCTNIPDQISGIFADEGGNVISVECPDNDSDGLSDVLDDDDDNDGVPDSEDNCVLVYNPGQEDVDYDGIGDVCDDHDGDGVLDTDDNCPDTANGDQSDVDGDGVGDVCDDQDGDGVLDIYDNCPDTANADQADTDGDGIGDVCDDDDADGVLDIDDNCPDVANADQLDSDNDGFGDCCEIVYVDADATGANDGTNWKDAFTSLTDALDAVRAGQDIWIAEGVYKPVKLYYQDDLRSACFQMKNGVGIYGGFAGTEVSRDQRDWEVNKVALSGDIGAVGFRGDNCYHVFYHPAGTNLDRSAVLDGVTVQDAGDGHSGPASAMYNESCSPVIKNCVFADNLGSEGAGICNRGDGPDDQTPLIWNCTFLRNQANFYGGAISSADGSAGGDLGVEPPVWKCKFFENSSNAYGGAVHVARWHVVDCVFERNQSSFTGGAVSLAEHVANCLFIDNSTIGSGGAVSGTRKVTNCLFVRNRALGDNARGGAVYVYGESLLTNCTFYENHSEGPGGAIFDRNHESVLSARSCIFWNNEPMELDELLSIEYSCVEGGFEGEGNIDVPPEFEDAAGGNFHLSADSPCVDGGINLHYPAGVETDLGGNKRIVDGDRDGEAVIDMGAYEGPRKEKVEGDVDRDGDVDLADLAILAANWLAGVN